MSEPELSAIWLVNKISGGFEKEENIIAQLTNSTESRRLRRVFFTNVEMLLQLTTLNTNHGRVISRPFFVPKL